MKTINVLGIDLAKQIFQLHGVDEKGRVVLKKKLSRNKLMEFVANLPPCLIGMESCGGAHYWGREFEKMGHKVKLIAAQFVKPYVKTNKNDAADAEAIVEALLRPHMRFVPIKQIQHHDLQAWLRVRDRLVRRRVALTNECHGLCLEYGIILSKQKSKFLREIVQLIDPEDKRLTEDTKELLFLVFQEFNQIREKIEQCDMKIGSFSKRYEACRRLQSIPGVGVLTATAVVAANPDPGIFKNGREFSASLGLVPRHIASGGKKAILGPISKRGDAYIRWLLIHGGRAVVKNIRNKTDRLSLWAQEKVKTRGTHKASVAVANKNARIIWALLNSGETYKAA